MLTAQRDASLLITCYNDVIDEARERRDAADKEGDDSAPVASVSGRVAVNAVEIVHVGYGHVTASDDVVAAGQSGLANMHVVRDTRISGYEHGR